MASSITFTDDVGAATLQNGKPSYGAHFSGWVPMKDPIGDAAYRLADEALTLVRSSWRYSASFTLEGVPASTVGGVRMVDIAARLIAHLKNGGQCSVTTDDLSSAVYATCGLTKGTAPSFQLTNRALMEYTFSVTLTNQAVSPVLMTCHYASVGGT